MRILLFIIIVSFFAFSCDSKQSKEKETNKDNVQSDESNTDSASIVEGVDEVEPARTIDELIYEEYGNFLDNEDDYLEPAQSMYTNSGFYVFLYEVYEGGNGEGDEGVILVCTVDENDYVIDHIELSNGYFGDVTEVWSEFDLIPDNLVCVYTEENGMNNVEMDEKGNFTGDSYNEVLFTKYTIGKDGYFSEPETQSESLTLQNNYLENKNDVLIKTIRRYYGIVEEKVNDGLYGSYPQSVGSNETYEYQNDDSWFNKIIHKKTDGAGTLFEDQYYFLRNELFFVFAKDNEKATEGRYYYHNNKLKVALVGKDKTPMTEEEMKNSEWFKTKVDEIIEQRESIISQMD